jgi:putative MATE family efflux protein
MSDKTTAGSHVNPLGSLPINQLLVRFAVPSIIATLVSALYNIVDQFYIGRSVGMLGNAATNVAFPLTITCTAISLMCGIGGAANFNLCMGRGEKEEATRYAGNVIFMLFSIGILLCLVVRIFLHPLMLLFGATADVLDYSLTYTGITSLGFPFLILTTGGSNLIRADGSPRFSMICTLTGAILNTILDPLFIFAFHMGMAGAALATIIGQIVSGIMVIVYLSHFKTVHLSLQSLIPIPSHCMAIASLGMSPFLNQIAIMVVQIVMNNTLRHYGALSDYGSEIPLACAGIISKVNMIFFSLVIGLSQGLQPIVSFNYGAKKYGRVQEAYLKTVSIATAISFVAFLCFQLFPRQIIGIFGTGSEAYFHFAEQYFRIYLFFTFLNGIQPITANFFTAIGKAYKGIFISLTRQIIFLLPLIILLPMFLGIGGIMYSAPVADFMAAVIAVTLAVRELRQMRKLY